MEQKPTESEWIEVRTSSIHGRGVYAKKRIPKGTKIIEYVGDVITKRDADLRAEDTLEKSEGHTNGGGVYIFELSKKYDIDGNVPWNTARLINHSCEPNCETTGDDEHVWIEARRDIEKGEELGYDYCYDIDDYEDHPCKCGSGNCVGYIIDEKLRGKVKKKIAKEIVVKN